MPEKPRSASASKTQKEAEISGSKGPSTPKILTLAQTFEQNSKQQASDTRKAVSAEFKKLRAHISEELRSSEQSSSAAIHAQNQRLRALALKGWLWMALSIALVLVASYGALWYTQDRVRQNLADIEALERQVRALKLQGGSVNLSWCDKKLCVQIDEKAPKYQEGYRIVTEGP